MSTINPNAKSSDYSNAKLYEFLATSYDISNLANRISADKNAPGNILNLKKRVGNNDIATA